MGHKYSRSLRVNKEALENSFIGIEESVKRDIIAQFVRELPMEEIEKIFTIKKIDPFSKEGKEIVMHSTEGHQLLRHLKEINAVQFEITL